MKYALASFVAFLFLLVSATTARSQPQLEQYDYHKPARMLVQRGMQAFMMCNGLYTSDRSLEQIYEQELKYYRMPAVPPYSGLVDVNDSLRAVAVGGTDNDPIPVMRAAYREGLGCVMLAPDQSFDDIDSLPELTFPALHGNAGEIEWPDGDLIPDSEIPAEIDREALQAAAEWAFDRDTHGHFSQITASLIVVYQGQIILERYAPGFSVSTKTRTWSTAKSIAVSLIGMQVDAGNLDLDEPLGLEWLPDDEGSEADPRKEITLRDVLQMSSGLETVDNAGGCEITGSCLSYWAGASAANGARSRGLIRKPGTHWDYENYDTILGLLAMKKALGPEEYLSYPRRALLDRIGMRNTIPGVDRFGDFVMSSQVYTNARDLARFGLLYLNRGSWNGEQILSEEWIDFVRTPAAASLDDGGFYGGQFWLVPDDRTDIPGDAYSTAGNRGQYVVIVPSQELVIVRRGLDWLPGLHGFSQWDLTREVMKALPERPWGEKPVSD